MGSQSALSIIKKSNQICQCLALMQALVCPHSAVPMQLQVTGCYTQWKPYQSAFFALVGWKRCSNHLFGLGWKRQEKILGIVFFVESRLKLPIELWKVDLKTWLWGEYRNPTEHIRHCGEFVCSRVSLVKYISLVHLLPSHLSLRDVLCNSWKELLFGFIVAPLCKQWIARFAFTFTILKEHHIF